MGSALFPGAYAMRKHKNAGLPLRTQCPCLERWAAAIQSVAILTGICSDRASAAGANEGGLLSNPGGQRTGFMGRGKERRKLHHDQEEAFTVNPACSPSGRTNKSSWKVTNRKSNRWCSVVSFQRLKETRNYTLNTAVFLYKKILMMISSSLTQALPSKEGLDYSGTCCRNDRRLFVDLLESKQ